MATRNQTVKANAKAETASTDVTKTKVLDGEILKPSKYDIKALDTKAAESGIKKLVAAGKSLRKLAHELACGILLHYSEHGDYTQIQRENDAQEPRLLEAIQESMSASMGRAFIDWTVRFSSLRYNEDTKRFYHNKRDKRIEDGKRGFFDMEAMAEGNEFFKFERPIQLPKALTAAEILALFANLESRLERIEKEATEGKEIDGKVKKIKHEIPAGLLTDFREFAKKHGVAVESESVN